MTARKLLATVRSMDRDKAAKAFEYKLQGLYDYPGLLSTEKVVVKNGPRAYKTASLLYWGNEATGAVRKTELRVQQWDARVDGPGYAFDATPKKWSCEDDEIKAVQALLNRTFPESGRYQLIGQGADVSSVVAEIHSGSVDRDAVQRIVAALSSKPELADALAQMDHGNLLAGLIERSRQQAGLRKWRQVVENPDSKEGDIQKVLEKEWWVFGGRYIRPAIRRTLVVGDQLDMALVRADGALHVIEIKQANIPNLIVKHRNHYRVGDDVHEAASQAMNYLRSLDEDRAGVLTRFHVDPRRAFATVVVGHPKFIRNGLSPELVSETIRTYNSHLSRVEVMTYADLLNGAECAFALADERAEEPHETDDPWERMSPDHASPWDDEPPF